MLTDLQRKKLPNLFHLHDVDGDGAIRQRDFDLVAHDVARARGLAPDSPEAAELQARFGAVWASMDPVAEDGAVTLDGWLAFWERVHATDGMYDEVVRPIGEFVFLLLDGDGDGAVTAEEYRRFYEIMHLGEADARRVFERLDLDDSGHLSRDEITVLLRQYFLSDDPDAPGNWFFGPYEEAAVAA